MSKFNFPSFDLPAGNEKRIASGIFKGLAVFVAAIFAIGYWYSHYVWIPAGQVGLIYNARTGLQRKVFEPHALFLGYFDQLYLYPTKLQAAIYSEDKDFGENASADAIEVTSSDSAVTRFDVFVLYRVKKEDVLTVFDKFGPISIEEVQTLHIRRAVREAVSAVGTNYDVFQLLGSKRQEASEHLTRELQNRLGYKGITVLRAMFGQCYPSADIGSKITGRVNSYTQLEISKLESRIAEVLRESAVVKGTADNSARTLTAEQTQTKSVDMLKLELEAQAIEKWKEAGGHLPTVTTKPGQTVIVNGSNGQVVTR